MQYLFRPFVHLPDLYKYNRVVCCPVQAGSGTRIKIIEAAAYGKTLTWEHEYEDETSIRAVGEDGVESSIAPQGIDRDWGRADLGLQLIGRNGWSGLFNVDFDFSRDDVDRLSYGIFIRKEMKPQ